MPSLAPGVPSTRPDWAKPQLLGCRNASSPDSETALRLATPYPSPSSCPNNSSSSSGPHQGARFTEGLDGDTRGGLHAFHDPQYTGVEAWSADESDGLENMFLSNRFDIGSLLMNLDTDNSWAVTASASNCGEATGLFYE